MEDGISRYPCKPKEQIWHVGVVSDQRLQAGAPAGTLLQAVTRCEGGEGDPLQQLRGPWKQESLLIERAAKPSSLDWLHMSKQGEILEARDIAAFVLSI